MNNSNDLRDFKEYELYPAMYGDLTRAFPEMHFRKISKGWVSQYHTDGTKDSKGTDTTYVYSNNRSRAIDYARGNTTLIDLYMSLHGADFSTAYRELASLYGLTLPSYSKEDEQTYRETQSSRETACKTFQEALWSGSPEAEATLKYLHDRRWDDEIIRKAGLGLITTEIIDTLPEDTRHVYRIRERKTVEENGQKVEKILGEVGKTHTLAIPYRSGGSILGFTFRRTFERDENSQKYLNSLGLRKSSLLNIGIGVKDIVIVEGYLDALHAQAMGLENVVATTQAKAADGMIQDALRRGVERFTLLYDMDEAGRKSIIPTIEAIHRLGGGKSIYIGSLPDGCKDTDEYLTTHTLEDFKDRMDEATPYAQYVLDTIIKKYVAIETEKGASTLKDREDFFSEVERLLNSKYIRPYEREDIFKALEVGENALNFKVSDYKEWVNQAYFRQQAATKAEATKKASTDIQEAVSRGDMEEAIRLMGDSHTALKELGSPEKYIKYLQHPSWDSIKADLREKPLAIETPYYFGQGEKRERLFIPSGQITFVCGKTSHGKSKMLQNLALSMAQDEAGGTVLYFTYEEDKESVIEQFENIFINHFINSKNLLAIRQYHVNGGFGEYVSSSSLYFKNNRFEEDERRFAKFWESGRLRVFDDRMDALELTDLIRYLCKQIRVKAVFVDYIQRMRIKGSSKPKNQMFCDIGDAFQDLATELGLPVVMAAQLTRETKSPIEMFNESIAESADLERVGNTIICLWYASYIPDSRGEWVATKEKDGKDKTQPKSKEQLHIEDLGFEEGNPGQLYAILTKSRHATRGLDTILDFDANTGRIKDGNRGQQELNFIDDNDDPF